MPFSRIVASLLILLASASAAELKIRVVDPKSAAVSGAEVLLLPAGGTVPVAVDTTSAEGQVLFRNLGATRYTLRVLAPGFAAQNLDVPPAQPSITVQLQVAPASETVVVSATRTPVPTESANADVATVGNSQLTLMNSVATNDVLRFLPGAVVNTAGRRGSLASLFVRGGESRYNKVIIDGVPVAEPGGTFDFGVVPLSDIDRLELVRGAQSTLYGSDAMTSVVQLWSSNGSTTRPEVRFGADGGTFGTADGYFALAGAYQRFDYDIFGDQFNTSGQGINDDYSNSLQGANLGFALSDSVSLRLRARHSNNRSAVQGEWNFNGAPLEPPDSDQWARQNNLLGSLELDVAGSSRWLHRFAGFEYHHQRANVDYFEDPGRIFDTPFHNTADFNRAGFDYQGDYQARSWARTTFGYQFEDENGFIGDPSSPPPTHGLWLNHSIFAQQMLTLSRISAVAGLRYEHHGGFGNAVSPRVGFTFQALRGGPLLSGTSLRFNYATGFKEPRMEEEFAGPPFSIPNPNLKPERARSFEAGVQQNLLSGRYALIATYFNNLFYDRIDYDVNPMTFIGQYINIDKSFAQGAELQLQGKLLSRLALDGGYTYTSTQNLEAPLCTPQNFCDPIFATGTPLLRRPRHSASLLLTYLGTRWGGNLGGSFVGRRPDSDFLGFNIDHAAGYVRVDTGAWYALNSHMTAYVNLENILNRRYNEVVGYPGLKANLRAGMRFRFGGE